MTKNEFLDKIVLGWIKHDLENISKIKVMPPADGNVNYPLALTTIIYMDHLGSYLLGKYQDLESNIGAYLNCFKKPTDYPPELLNDLFRNGLGHDYFSRGAISRKRMRPPMAYAPGLGVVLDADSLLDDFLDSLENFGNKLSENNFNKRFAEAGKKMKKCYSDHQSIIDKLPKLPPQQPTTSPATFSANASGTAIYSESN